MLQANWKLIFTKMARSRVESYEKIALDLRYAGNVHVNF